MLLKFNNFIKEGVEGGTLFFYSFDWDDNILNMPTEIMVTAKDGSEVGMNTADFAVYRSKIGKEEFEYDGKTIVGLKPETAFRNFRDVEDPEIFKKDVAKALEQKRFAPAWKDFIECLTSGAIFSIITARGHEKEGMRKGVEYIIDNFLSDAQKQEMYDNLLKFVYKFDSADVDALPRVLRGVASQNELVKDYLDLCHFIGVSAPSRGGSPSNPEAAKEDALRDFIKDVNEYAGRIGYTAKVGFSDDDPGNIRHVKHALSSQDLNHEELWPFVDEFVIKDTNLPHDVVKTNIPTKSVKSFAEFSEGMDPMATSTISMQTPNAAMSGSMDSVNPFIAQRIGQVKLLSKLGNEALSKRKKKRF